MSQCLMAVFVVNYEPLVLRKCRVCGVKAYNEDDLELFQIHLNSSYVRQNLCNDCRNKRRRERRTDIPAVNLRNRFSTIKQRCYNPKHKSYDYYGGRGITICEEWLDNPDSFIEWSLSNGFEVGLCIDRINNDGSYSPENCRWTTRLVQVRNRGNNVTNFLKMTRICSVCKVEKLLFEFPSTGRGYTVCIDCKEKSRGQELRGVYNV